MCQTKQVSVNIKVLTVYSFQYKHSTDETALVEDASKLLRAL